MFDLSSIQNTKVMGLNLSLGDPSDDLQVIELSSVKILSFLHETWVTYLPGSGMFCHDGWLAGRPKCRTQTQEVN